ncbi:MAG: transglycosylase domain-containing protein [Polyangiales bacterium]
MVETRVREQLARRGLSWKSADQTVRWRGLSFEGVELERAGSGEPLAKIMRVEVDLGWMRALRDPRGAVDDVRIAGVAATLDIETLRELRASRGERGAKPSAGEPSEARALPSIRLTDGEVALDDAHGVLVHAQITEARLAADAWQVIVSRVEVGDQASEFVKLDGLQLSGTIAGRRPRFARGVVAAASLVLRSPRDDDGDGDDGAPPREANVRLAERIADLRVAMRVQKDDAAEAGEAEDAEPTEPSSLWTSDARLEVHSAQVMDGGEQPAKPVLEKLNLALLAEGEKSLRVKGDGLTTTGGSLQWDLHITPSDARIEGRVALKQVPLVLFAPVLPKLPFHELEKTRVAANLAITGRGLETASVRGELSISELAFASERLARVPVGPISFTARGEGTWTPARRELSSLRGELVSGATRVLLTGELAWPKGGYRVDVGAELPSSKCSAVAATVPSGLLDELADVRLSGDVKAKVDVHVDSEDLDATKLNFDIKDKCKFDALPEQMSTKRFEKAFTHRVLEPDDTVFEMATGPGTPAWTPIELISPFMIQAVVAHEDGRFFTHRGFAESEIGAALARNLKARAFKFGASTITMQLVKNVFLHRDKLLSRKVQEALIVWWLEQQVDKKWILELYLNVIEYGTGVYGIRNAALHYFGTLPIHLTPAQAAFLATILPSPKAYDEQYEKGTISDSTKKRVTSFLQHMRSRERIDEVALAFGLEELAAFRFYDPDQPPPATPQMRGTAQAPPFALPPADPQLGAPVPTNIQPAPQPREGYGIGY